MTNLITFGLGSLKSAMDTVKSINATITEAEVARVRVEITSHLIAAHTAMLDLLRTQLEDSDTIRALKAEIVKLEDWHDEAARYELGDVGQGAVAYALKQEEAAGEVLHWLCPSCFANGKKSFLQPEWLAVGEVETLRCHPCGLTLYVRGNADQVPLRGAR